MVIVVLWTTGVSTTLKGRTDITRIRHILDSKKAQYEEVDLSEQSQRRQEMLDASGGESTLPQLHINGCYIGTADDVQEYEDWGELDTLLEGVSLADVHAASAAKHAASAEQESAAAPESAREGAKGSIAEEVATKELLSAEPREPTFLPAELGDEAPAEPSDVVQQQPETRVKDPGSEHPTSSEEYQSC